MCITGITKLEIENMTSLNFHNINDHTFVVLYADTTDVASEAPTSATTSTISTRVTTLISNTTITITPKYILQARV